MGWGYSGFSLDFARAAGGNFLESGGALPGFPRPPFPKLLFEKQVVSPLGRFREIEKALGQYLGGVVSRPKQSGASGRHGLARLLGPAR
jgi:hypothetical protein